MKSNAGFDFTAAMTRLCHDVCERLEVFQHISMDQVAVTFAQARTAGIYGIQAKLTPLRFERGALTHKKRGRTWTIQRVYVGQREMLYILTFYLPRFQDNTFLEKMITVLHELYHIGTRFDGDIRRFEGRYHAHSCSQKEYDRLMERYVNEYLSLAPPPELYHFLEVDFRTLMSHHGRIYGCKMPTPKLIPIPEDRRSA
jgi:predicted metallopeptidase